MLLKKLSFFLLFLSFFRCKCEGFESGNKNSDIVNLDLIFYHYFNNEPIILSKEREIVEKIITAVNNGVVEGKISGDKCKELLDKYHLEAAYIDDVNSTKIMKEDLRYTLDGYYYFSKEAGVFTPSTFHLQDSLKDVLYDLSQNKSEEVVREKLYDFCYFKLSSIFPEVYTSNAKNDYMSIVKDGVDKMLEFPPAGKEIGSKAPHEINVWFEKVSNFFSDDSFVAQVPQGEALSKVVTGDPKDFVKRFFAKKGVNFQEMVAGADEHRDHSYGFNKTCVPDKIISTEATNNLALEKDNLNKEIASLRADLESVREKVESCRHDCDVRNDNKRDQLKALEEKIRQLCEKYDSIASVDLSELKKCKELIDDLGKWKAAIVFSAAVASFYVVSKVYDFCKKKFVTNDDDE